MTIYKGKTTPRNLMALLNTIMIAEGYVEVTGNAALDGRVYRGTEGGKNEFYIQFKLPSATNIGYSMGVGFYEKYTPGANSAAGTFVNGYLNPQVMIWNNSATYINLDMGITYIINANASRLIIYVQGNALEPSSPTVSLTFVGMPDRYDPNDTGPGFGGVGGTIYSLPPGGNGNNWRAIKGRTMTAVDYPIFFYSAKKAQGWGRSLFASPLCLIHRTEGARGEFPGILVIPATGDYKHGDLISYNGKFYILLNYSMLNTTAGTGITLPWGTSYLMEIEEGFDNGFLYR